MTAAQKSPCAELAAALDAGDYEVYRRAEPSLSPAEKGEIWDQRQHVKAMAERAAQGQKAGFRFTPVLNRETEMMSHDLDHWADAPDVEPDDEPDDTTDQTTKLCPTCRGSGRQKDGSQCSECAGSGRVPIDPDQEDDDDFEDEN